eukprot:scaffold183198_cov43-Attheya_sp.AAC.1
MLRGSEDNVIPSALWEATKAQLLDKKNRARKRKSGAKESAAASILVRKFHYDISREAWSLQCECNEERNLFFEYISRTRKKFGGSEDYISVQFGDGNDLRSRRDKPSSSNMGSLESDTIRDFMLRRGIKSPSGEHFRLLGCSNSQVKNFSFLFRRKVDSTENEELLDNILPELSQWKKGIPKRVKYTGLLFSGVQSFVELPESTCIREIDSIERGGFDFTDGPGLVSMKLAREISKQMNLPEIPSVFQIRYGGMIERNSGGNSDSHLCKGVLLVDPTEDDKYIISFRKSMLKIGLSDGDWTLHMNNKLGIVDYSKRIVGKLNQQLICLLSANVPPEELLHIQDVHLDTVRNCWSDPFSFGYLAAMEPNTKRWEFYEQLLLQNEMVSDRLPSRFVMMAPKRNRYCNDLGKLQIHLGSSRSLFGSVFPEQLGDYLRDGQCLVFTDQGLLVDTVIVSRSPSYTTGDVRVLEAVDLEGVAPPLKRSLLNFRNCILFSTQGDRPEADKMSGGDMDGDQYLVIWDKRLTKHASQLRMKQPANYDSMPPKPGHNAQLDWIAYVSQFDDSMLGRVDRAFYTTAKEKGIKSEEAKQLNLLFSSLVDKNLSSLKEFERLAGSSYITGKATCVGNDLCIWEKMVQRQLECSKDIRKGRCVPDFDGFAKFMTQVVSAPWGLAQRIACSSHKEHFTSNVSSKKLSNILMGLNSRKHSCILDDTNTKSKHEEGDEATIMREELQQEFTTLYARWEATANSVFKAPLKEWDVKRKHLLEKLESEYQHKQQQIQLFDDKREYLVDQSSRTRRRLEEVGRELIEFLIKEREQ